MNIQTHRRNRKKKEAAVLMRELQSYEDAGARLYIGDELCEPQDIVRACIFSENSDYMRDFITNDGTQVSELHFVRIRGSR